MASYHYDEHANLDAALITLDRELVAAMVEESALPISDPNALGRANDRVWATIERIGAIEAQTDAGRLAKARAAARAYLELARIPDEDMADDERALAALVRAFFPGEPLLHDRAEQPADNEGIPG